MRHVLNFDEFLVVESKEFTKDEIVRMLVKDYKDAKDKAIVENWIATNEAEDFLFNEEEEWEEDGNKWEETNPDDDEEGEEEELSDEEADEAVKIMTEEDSQLIEIDPEVMESFIDDMDDEELSDFVNEAKPLWLLKKMKEKGVGAVSKGSKYLKNKGLVTTAAKHVKGRKGAVSKITGLTKKGKIAGGVAAGAAALGGAALLARKRKKAKEAKECADYTQYEKMIDEMTNEEFFFYTSTLEHNEMELVFNEMQLNEATKKIIDTAGDFAKKGAGKTKDVAKKVYNTVKDAAAKTGKEAVKKSKKAGLIKTTAVIKKGQKGATSKFAGLTGKGKLAIGGALALGAGAAALARARRKKKEVKEAYELENDISKKMELQRSINDLKYIETKRKTQLYKMNEGLDNSILNDIPSEIMEKINVKADMIIKAIK